MNALMPRGRPRRALNQALFPRGSRSLRPMMIVTRVSHDGRQSAVRREGTLPLLPRNGEVRSFADIRTGVLHHLIR